MSFQHHDLPLDAPVLRPIHAGDDGRFVVPENSQLFSAKFERAGPDLLLLNEDAEPLLLVGYFSTSQPADIQTPNGAILRGETAEALAGPVAPGLFAQQGDVPAGQLVGQVENLNGTATVQRLDGTRVEMGPETRIFLGDLVETGADTELSLTFTDGTIFTLSANARMVIDEFLYDAGGNDNGAIFNLIQGGFVFIAGQVAPTGGMEIVTPTATMGIRGTTVLVDVETIDGVMTVEVALTRDPDGSIGRIEVFDLQGTPIADITTTDTKWVITADGAEPQQVQRTQADEAEDSALISEAFSAFEAANARQAAGGQLVNEAPAETAVPGIDGGTGGVPPLGGQNGGGGGQAPAVPPPAPNSDTQSSPPTQQEGGLRDGGGRRSTPLPDDETIVVENTAPAVQFIGLQGLEDGAGGILTGQIPVAGDLPASYAILSSPQNGTVVLNADGSYSYTPNPDFNGVDNFSFLVTDSLGRTTIREVRVEIEAVNDAPSVTLANSSTEGTISEDDQVLSGVLSAVDVDSSGALTWSGDAAGQFGTFSIDSTSGEWTYSVNPASAQTLGAGAEAVEEFVVSVADAEGATSDVTVSVTVAGANDAPEVTNAVLESFGGDPVSGQLQAQDPDIGDTLTYELVSSSPFGSTVTITPDGQFTYVPNPAFSGVDQFTYQVTDSQGATSLAKMSVVVAGPVFPGPLPEALSVQFDPAGGDPALPGRILVSEGAPTQAVNLTLVLDWSAAVTTAEIDAMIADVQAALSEISARFEGSDTQVDVHVVSLPFGGFLWDAFDLRDPLLQTALETLDTSEPATLPLSVSLVVAESSIKSQPLGEEHYLYIFTPGDSDEASAASAIASLTDTATNGFDVTIEAFSFGGATDQAVMEVLDPTPQVLEGPETITNADFAEPFTQAELVDFSVTLVADGVNQGEIADENSPALQEDQGEYTLVLGDVDGLDALLGTVNEFEVSAGFDLDGDTSTVELTLFSSSGPVVLAAPLIGAPVIPVPGQSVTASLAGREVADFAIGGDVTGALLSFAATTPLDGVDLDNGLQNSLTLDGQDLLGLTDGTDPFLDALLSLSAERSVTVYGDDQDSITLVSDAQGSFAAAPQGSLTDPATGEALDLYTYSEAGVARAIIAVDSDVDVNLAAAATP